MSRFVHYLWGVRKLSGDFPCQMLQQTRTLRTCAAQDPISVHKSLVQSDQGSQTAVKLRLVYMSRRAASSETHRS